MRTGWQSAAVRWVKFNLVGMAGVAVQLIVLALLSGPMGLPYLPATAIAVELTVLHNYVWHERCTWRDRSGGSIWRLAQFHMSNGAVSLAGNLVLMKLFMDRLHISMLIANAIAICICSVINFFLADRWVFSANSSELPTRPSLSQ